MLSGHVLLRLCIWPLESGSLQMHVCTEVAVRIVSALTLSVTVCRFP